MDVPRQVDEESEVASKPKDNRTPAQIAFDRVQEKRVEYINHVYILGIELKSQVLVVDV